VSQLHARAIRRLRVALGEMGPQHMAEMRRAFIAFAASKAVVVKAQLPKAHTQKIASPPAVVLPYKPADKRPVAVRATIRMSRPRQAVAAAR
jgi:hypothetical protein